MSASPVATAFLGRPEGVDPNTMTPIEALMALAELKRIAAD